ncbi:DUF1642 domain-containing protein [Streptococcus sp. TATVAM-FAB35]|uniref:DUF1642 domain-containing protein n=1 Tax=Streptococcus TaxID=1301 RepID=UPI00397FEF43
MNKQEAIEKIEELKKLSCGALGYDWISLGIDKALNVVKQLDEPEKPVLTKAEAEWLEGLRKAEAGWMALKSKADLLYYITRAGLETNLGFEFYDEDSDNMFELEEHDSTTKMRLVYALLFGYTIEKEKLYTVKFSNEDFGKIYIGIIKSANKLGFSTLPMNDKYSKCYFTESELKELKFWENPAFEIDEVKE